MSFHNKEHYPDPTAYEALKNVDKPKKLVFICSPYQGDISINIIRAKRYGRFAVTKKVVPVIPHLMYPRFLDEYTPEERALGLELGLVLLGKCNELWVFGDKISGGMKVEIEKAKEMKIPIKYFDISCNPLGGNK